MPIGDRPVLDIVVRQLKAHGFEQITIATGYLAELIEAFFGDGEKYGIPIDYYREHEPLGTVGALALIGGLGDDDVLVMNGDVLTESTTASCSKSIARATPRRRSRPRRGRSRSRWGCCASATTPTRRA